KPFLISSALRRGALEIGHFAISAEKGVEIDIPAFQTRRLSSSRQDSTEQPSRLTPRPNSGNWTG
ncbi:MAG: hypothetical protein DMG06_05280, partial [Acidobacteria bacterium]